MKNGALEIHENLLSTLLGKQEFIVELPTNCISKTAMLHL